MYERCGPRPKEAAHEVVGRHGGCWGGVVQIDDEDVHDIVGCRAAKTDEEEEDDRKVDGNV